MLRILIVVLACITIPAMTIPAQREPFFYRRPPNLSPTLQQPYTIPPITIKPASTEPVNTEPVISIDDGQRSPFVDAYIFKSLQKLEDKVNEDVAKVNNLLAARPDYLNIQLPVANGTRLTQYRPLPVYQQMVKPVNVQTVRGNLYASQVSTDKPIYGENVDSDEDRKGKPLSHFNKKPVNTVTTHKEKVLKSRLMSLFMSSKKDVNNQKKSIQLIHNTFKSRTMYKIGYLTSLINKLNSEISQLYDNVRNDHDRDALSILTAYEQVKKDNEIIQELLKMMHTFLRTKGQPMVLLKEPGTRVSPKKNFGISWSYYDDTMP